MEQKVIVVTCRDTEHDFKEIKPYLDMGWRITSIDTCLDSLGRTIYLTALLERPLS